MPRLNIDILESNQKGATHVLLIVLLVVGLIGAVYLVQRQTNLTPKAYEAFLNSQSDVDPKFGSSNTQFGIQIDTNVAEKIPNSNVMRNLNPRWLRYVYRPEKGIPDAPINVKKLIIFNNESAPPAPIGKTDFNIWKNYVDNVYLPALKDFLNSYSTIDAIEIWNEQDFCDGEYYCPGVPEKAYAYMLKNASQMIKEVRPNTKVVMGGLTSGDVHYVSRVRNYDSSAFDNVDAIGIHPYAQSPDGWCKAD